MILTVDELNRVDDIYRKLPAPGYLEHASVKVFAAVSAVLDKTERSQFLCAFASTHAVGAGQLFQTQSQRTIHYANCCLLDLEAAHKMLEENFLHHRQKLTLEESEAQERLRFTRELLPLAGGHPRLISALAYEGARATVSVWNHSARRDIMREALKTAGLKTDGWNADMVLAALRGKPLTANTVITTVPILDGVAVVGGSVTYDFLMQRGYYQYVHAGTTASVPVIAPMQMKLIALDDQYPWCKHLRTISEQQHCSTGFEQQVLYLVALQLEIAIADGIPELPILESFARKDTVPLRSKAFNEDACIPLSNKRVLIKKYKSFVALAADVSRLKHNELWLVWFETTNQPGFDVVLLYRVGQNLFPVCLEMKSQVGEKDINMEFDTLSDKFDKFQEQVTKFSKFACC